MRSCLPPSLLRNTARCLLPEGRLVHVELVGIDGTLHDIFAQAIGAGDHDDVTETRFRIEGEDDAARADVGTDHFHDADR
jgi:hypothetical protein